MAVLGFPFPCFLVSTFGTAKTIICMFPTKFIFNILLIDLNLSDFMNSMIFQVLSRVQRSATTSSILVGILSRLI